MEQQNMMFDFRPQRKALTGILIAGLYLRLSKEDVKFGYSVSIETQEAILRAYCERNGITIHEVYIDDGLSGGNYNRPDFIRMKNDMDEGIIKLRNHERLVAFGQRPYHDRLFDGDIFSCNGNKIYRCR